MSTKKTNSNTKASTQLRTIEKGLHLKSGLTAEDKKRALPLLRVDPDAMSVAVDVAERHPDRFVDFDVAMVRGAAAYEQAMAPLAQQCRDLADRIDESIIATKLPAAQQTLALYAAAKSLVRFRKGESMIPQVRAMKFLIRTRIKHRKPAEQPSAAPPPTTESPKVVATNASGSHAAN